jgi:hypothetical protein
MSPEGAVQSRLSQFGWKIYELRGHPICVLMVPWLNIWRGWELPVLT